LIDGVKIIKLTTHGDERGFFREIFRFPEQFSDVPVGQLSHSMVNEGIVKAWHGHVKQSQWNYVVSGQIKVALFDNREDSSTYKESMEFVGGNEIDPITYFFPPGVLHGYKCTKGPMQIIYVTTGVYDLKDEIRKTDEDLEIGYIWQ
jgi:dTDP-4-dehydrorhamnose 3,5-epimerase